jgi:MOSC domain-containing protein YiiM
VIARPREELDAGLADVLAAPRDRGTLELIVRRPGPMGERELLDLGRLDPDAGLEGDRWAAARNGRRRPEAQLTIMSARAAALVTGVSDHERWAQAGDQLYVDFDISQTSLPAGSRLEVGEAVVEITADPHTGCSKFSRRFGVDALKFVNTKRGRELRLRGVNARVVEGGEIRPGDGVRRLAGTD